MAMGLASNKTKELLKAEEDADNEALPVNQDNDTVIVIPTNDTTTAEITEISTEEMVTETKSLRLAERLNYALSLQFIDR